MGACFLLDSKTHLFFCIGCEGLGEEIKIVKQHIPSNCSGQAELKIVFLCFRRPMNFLLSDLGSQSVWLSQDLVTEISQMPAPTVVAPLPAENIWEYEEYGNRSFNSRRKNIF